MMSINIKLLTIGFVVISLSKLVYCDENWCDPLLCKDGLSHTACDHYLEFSDDCGDDAEFIILSSDHRRLILDFHNNLRNKIASGGLGNYESASRMPVLRWNEDLAYLAGIHVRSCTTESDGCRNTRIFKHVGQNLGQYFNENLGDVDEIIQRILITWQQELKLGNQNNMKALDDEDEMIDAMARFTMMINDRSQDIGCAFIRFKIDEFFHSYLTCNYGSNLHYDSEIYESGRACSKCNSGCDKIWTSLCTSDEKLHDHDSK